MALTPDPIDFFGCAGDYAELSTGMTARICAVLASGQVLQGKEVARFEARIADMTGRRHAVATGSGTDALYFALLGAGIGPGDEVLLPTVTFIACASAILRTGARPVFVDIGADLGMDLAAAPRSLTAKTRALLYVHLFGSMGDPADIAGFAARHGLVLIEDCAQSLGARHGGHPAGSLGLVSATSFDPTKVLSAPGGGGALLTDDDRLAARARRLRLHGKDATGYSEPGFNSQLPSLAAAVLDLKLDQFAAWTLRRAEIARLYCAALADLPVVLPPVASRVDHVWHKFVIRHDRRDALARHLGDAGIPTRIHYERPLHLEPVFGQHQNDADFPNAGAYCRTTLSLPIHSHMTTADAGRVTRAIRDFCR